MVKNKIQQDLIKKYLINNKHLILYIKLINNF